MSNLLEENYRLWSQCIPDADKYYKRETSTTPSYTRHTPQEIQTWLDHLHLPQFDMVIILGVEDGTVYKLLKPWLNSNPKHIAIFAENNPMHLKQFLSTEVATELLTDNQAWFVFGNTADEISSFLILLFQTYPFQNPLFAALPKRDPAVLRRLTSLGRLIWINKRDNANEYHHASKGFTHNLYQNFYLLPESKDFTPFLNAFKNVPAIIAGAGPSLAKNRHLLNEFKDKALLIGGGTAINALNAGNVQPHLGVGIDPNHQFYNRILSNTAWEVPFVYYYRMYHKALSLVHGDKLFLKFSAGVSIDDWLHKKLNIHFSPPYKKEFLNVVNLATYMALSFGCNPIIFVGIDLAYTNDSSYAAGLRSIAAQATATEMRTKHPSEQIIIRKDIYGQPIKTLWKWVMESLWYSNLIKEFPHINFINCTEGGLGFQGIPNATLAETTAKYCTTDRGVQKLVDETYKSCPWCTHAPPEEISSILKEFHKSLENCAHVVSEELDKLNDSPQDDLWETSELPCEARLVNEPAYTHLLKPFDSYIYSRIALPFYKLDALKDRLPPEKYTNEKINTQKSRYKRFLTVIKDNQKSIEEAIAAPHLPSLFPLKDPPPEPIYEGETLKTFYPNGSPKSIIPKRNGLLDGEVLLYYHNGMLSHRLHFIQGKKEGLEEIWDRNGQLLAQSEYKDDKPAGTAFEWHPNGQRARKTVYDDEGRPISSETWNKLGEATFEKRQDTDSFLQEVREQIAMLKGTLLSILKQLTDLGIANLDLEKELHEQLKKVHVLEKKIQPFESVYSQDTKEALWMTPSSTDDIRWELTSITSTLSITIPKVENWIRKTLATTDE